MRHIAARIVQVWCYFSASHCTRYSYPFHAEAFIELSRFRARSLEITRRNLRPPLLSVRARTHFSQDQIHRGNHDGNEIATLSNWENFPQEHRVTFSLSIALFATIGLCRPHSRAHFAALPLPLSSLSPSKNSVSLEKYNEIYRLDKLLH